MGYLGLDLGSKTIGIAISESGIIANSLETYRFKENDYEQARDYILTLSKKLGIDKIVLGYPKHMNNDVGIRGKISEDFKKMIEDQSKIEVILWDERLSTQTAIKALIKGFERRDTQKKKKDEVAAVLILQNYLDYKGAKSL